MSEDRQRVLVEVDQWVEADDTERAVGIATGEPFGIVGQLGDRPGWPVQALVGEELLVEVQPVRVGQHR